MGIVLEEAVVMRDKLYVMARKATYRTPLDDLVQGFYAKVLEKEGSYNSEKSSVRTWLYTVFQNYIRNLIRRQSITPVRYYSCTFDDPELQDSGNPFLDAPDEEFQDRIDGIEKRIALRQATFNLLSWLKEHDYEGWKVLNSLLRKNVNHYEASIEANTSVSEINSIITRIRKYDITQRLIELL